MAAGAGRTEPTWALVSARAEGISIRTLAVAAGLSPSRVHQLVADADPEALDATPDAIQSTRPQTVAYGSRLLFPLWSSVRQQDMPAAGLPP